jgi:hypothetical protein
VLSVFFTAYPHSPLGKGLKPLAKKVVEIALPNRFSAGIQQPWLVQKRRSFPGVSERF